MVTKEILKQILISNQEDIVNYKVFPRSLPTDEFQCRVFTGVRRCGKSYMLYQKIQELLSSGHTWKEMLYVNFEDDRLGEFAAGDFNLILEAHSEMYGVRPMIFLDEPQIINGWDKFARRLADRKFFVWITGSNAKMLSSEVMGVLGGRYLPTEVYPFGFAEFLDFKSVNHDEISLLGTESRSRVVRFWSEYLSWGGLPEALGLDVKRNYISSTLQKIYLSDIAARNRIGNTSLLRLLVKKLAENVGQPISYNRLAHTLSSVAGKISMPTVSKYIDYCEDACLCLRLRNITSRFSEKESHCKYYFIDNGILNLFLFSGETKLLENVVALALFKKYGYDKENDRVFFYGSNVEVDFYVPEDELAVQVSYSVDKSSETLLRETDALTKLPSRYPCKRRLILTNEDSGTIEDEFGIIEKMPVWQWLLLLYA